MKTNEIINDCLGNLNPSVVLDLGIGKGRCSKRFLKEKIKIIGADKINRGLPKGINFIKSNI